jgi:hypothetical protein
MGRARILAYISGTMDQRANDAADHAVARCSAAAQSGSRPMARKDRRSLGRLSRHPPMSQVRTEN